MWHRHFFSRDGPEGGGMLVNQCVPREPGVASSAVSEHFWSQSLAVRFVYETFRVAESYTISTTLGLWGIGR